MLAGAAIGAYTQDPTEHPVAGLVGLGIGAYVGNSINVEVVGMTDRAKPASESIRIDSSKIGRAEPQFDQIYKSVNRQLRRASRFDNSPKVKESYVRSVMDVYKQLGGTVDTDFETNPRFTQMILNAGSTNIDVVNSMPNMAREVFGNAKEADLFLTANKLIRFDILEDLSNQGKAGQLIGAVNADFSKMTDDKLNLNRRAKEKTSISISDTSKIEDKESIVKQYLIEKLYYPEDAASKQAANIARLTDGAGVTISGSELKVISDSEQALLRLDEYSDNPEITRPYRLSDTGNMYASKRHNPFLNESIGKDIGMPIAVNRADGSGLTTTSVITQDVKMNQFSQAEAALLEWNATGRVKPLSEIYTNYKGAEELLGNYQTIMNMSKDQLYMVNQALQLATITDASRQMRIGQDGERRFGSIDHNRLKDISQELEILNSYGFQHTYQGVGINAVSDINIGNRELEKVAYAGVVQHQERATDGRLSRRTPYATRSDATGRALDNLAAQGYDVTQFGNSSTVQVKGVSRSVDSILNHIAGGITVADGQTILRRGALSGALVGVPVTIKMPNLQDSEVFDLTENLLTEDARRVTAGESALTEFKGGQSLAVTKDGRTIKIPDYITNAKLDSAYLNDAGESVFSFKGYYNPVSEGSSTVKMFGDIKSTGIVVDDTKFRLMSTFASLENMGMLSPETGANWKVLDALKKIGITPASNTYKDIGESVASLDKEAVSELQDILKVYGTGDVLIREKDSALSKWVNDGSNMSEGQIRSKVSEMIDGLDESSNIRRIALEMLESGTGKAHYAGIGFALSAMTDSKSSQTAMATLINNAADDVWHVEEREMLKQRGAVIEANIKKYSRMAALSEAGNIDAQNQMFRAMKEVGTQIVESGKNYTRTFVSIDTPIPDTRTPSASWMQVAEMVAQFGGDAIAEGMMNAISSKNHSALYEARAMLSGAERRGKTLTDTFGSDYSQMKMLLGNIFKPGEGKSRADALKEFYGMTPDDGVLNIKLARPGNVLQNVPVTLYDTNRSGVMNQDGIDMLPRKDSQTLKVLQAQLLLEEAQAAGKGSLIPLLEKSLDDEVSALEKIYSEMDKPLSKEVGKRISNVGMDALMLATGGENAQIWEAYAKQGENVVFANKYALSKMGIDVNAKSVDAQHRHLINDPNSPIDLGDRSLVSNDAEGKFPVMFNMGREPVAGPNSNFQGKVIYDPALDRVKESALFFTENIIGPQGSQTSRVMLSNADFDGDKIRAMDISPLMRDKTSRDRITQNMQTYTDSFFDKSGALNTALLAKGKGGGKQEIRVEKGSAVLDSVEARFKGQERKNMAPLVTEVAQIISNSIRESTKIEEAKINTDFKVSTQADIDKLPPSQKAAYDQSMEALRRKRTSAMSVNQFFVEKTLKAIHGSGGANSEVEAIIDTLKKSNPMNNKAEEAAAMIRSSIMTAFGENADKMGATTELEEAAEFISKSVRTYGGSIATDTNRMVGGSGPMKSVTAALKAAARNSESLPEEAVASTIKNTQDVQASIIQTVKNNRYKVLGGIGALGATAFVLGSETPDMTSPMANSPTARQKPVLPPIKSESGYITSPIDRNRAPQGSISINGTMMSSYGDDGLKQRLSNMFTGNQAGRTTVRYQSHESY